MPSDHDIAVMRARQAWWLKILRETDPRKPTLPEVAKASGLKIGSASVVSLWENNKAVTGPKYEQLVRLARFYGVPLTVLTEPKETDEERAASLRQLALGAVAVGDQDLEEEGAAPRPQAGAGPAGKPRRRSA